MPGILAQYPKGMVNDLYKIAWEAKEYDPTPQISKEIFAEIEKPKGAYLQTTSMVGMGQLRETSEDEGYNFRSTTEGYTVYAKPFDFTDGISLTENAVEDNAHIDNLLKDSAATWGGSEKETEEIFYATWFNKGGFTSGYRYFNGTVNNGPTDASGDGAYDGLAAAIVPNFNLTTGTARTSIAGTSYYNALALTLTPENFETLWNRISVTNAYNEADQHIHNRPNVLVVPGALEFTARRLLESTLIPGSTDNDKNVLQAIVDLKVCSFLTTSTAWYLGQKKKGLKSIEWKPLTIDYFEDQKYRRRNATCVKRLLGVFTNFRFWGASNSPTS